MEKLDQGPKHHIFICCRDKQGKACCAEKGAEKLAEGLKKWVKSEGLKGQIKVTKSLCLGHCEDGITACIYPENQWYTHLKPKDEDQLKQILTDLLTP